jgi:hypothetical protein
MSKGIARGLLLIALVGCGSDGSPADEDGSAGRGGAEAGASGTRSDAQAGVSGGSNAGSDAGSIAKPDSGAGNGGIGGSGRSGNGGTGNGGNGNSGTGGSAGDAGSMCPNPCSAGTTCDETSGACCATACQEGETTCSGGMEHRCQHAGVCSEWVMTTTCDGDCAADGKRCEPSGVRIEQWGTEWSDTLSDSATSPSGGVLLIGSASRSVRGEPYHGSVDAVLFAVDPLGDATANWVRQIGTASEDYGVAVMLGTAGQSHSVIYTQGDLAGPSKGDRDVALVETNGAGQEAQRVQWGGSSTDRAADGAVGRDGDLWLAGETYSVLGASMIGENDAFVVRMSPTGAVRWVLQWGSADIDRADAVAVDADENAYVCGRTRAQIDPQAGTGPVFCSKVDGAGTLLWTKQWGEASNSVVSAILALPGGGFVTAGNHTSASAGFLNFYDGAGALLRSDSSPGRSTTATSMALGPAGSFFVAGTTAEELEPGAKRGGGDAFVQKRDIATRDAVWTRQFGTTTDELDVRVALGTGDTVFLAGKTDGAFAGFVNRGMTDWFLVTLPAAAQ